MTKKWYTSKTLWTNIIAIAGGLGAWATTGDSTPLAVSGLGVLNFALRLITKQGIE